MSDDVKREDSSHGDLIKKILETFNEYIESLSEEELQELSAEKSDE